MSGESPVSGVPAAVAARLASSSSAAAAGASRAPASPFDTMLLAIAVAASLGHVAFTQMTPGAKFLSPFAHSWLGAAPLVLLTLLAVRSHGLGRDAAGLLRAFAICVCAQDILVIYGYAPWVKSFLVPFSQLLLLASSLTDDEPLPVALIASIIFAFLAIGVNVSGLHGTLASVGAELGRMYLPASNAPAIFVWLGSAAALGAASVSIARAITAYRDGAPRSAHFAAVAFAICLLVPAVVPEYVAPIAKFVGLAGSIASIARWLSIYLLLE